MTRSSTSFTWAGHVIHRAWARFVLVSGAGYAFDITLLLALQHLERLPQPVNVSIAFWVTYSMNFAINRSFAFRAARRAVLPQLRRYLPQVLVDFALTLVAVQLLTSLTGLALLPARMAAAGANLAFNYAAYRWWTFADHLDHTGDHASSPQPTHDDELSHPPQAAPQP